MSNQEDLALHADDESTTCYVVDSDGLEVVDGNTILFEAGQTVQLEDGSTAYLSSIDDGDTGNLHRVELENGTTAYIALNQTTVDSLGLDQNLQLIEAIDASASNFLKIEHLQDTEDDNPNVESDAMEYSLGLEEGDARTQFSILELETDDTETTEEATAEGHLICDEGITLEEGQLHHLIEEETIEEPENSDEMNNPDEPDEVDDDEEDYVVESRQRGSHSDKIKNYVCTVPGCSKKYTASHHLKVHVRTHTGDRPYSCTEPSCDKRFGTNYALKAHIRTHTGEKPYHCPEESCGKGFKTSGDLQKHIRTHTGERPFKCNVPGCNRSFTTSNIRKVHVRTHTGERPYECTEPGCGRAFASATNFKNHMRIHSGEKPYVCTVKMCGRRFTEYSSLYKHQTVHTQQKPYECRDCGRQYRQSSTLTMHRRTAHGIIQALDGSEIVLSLPDNAGKIENFMFLELAKDGNTLIPLSTGRGVGTSNPFAHTIEVGDDSEDNDSVMASCEVIEEDDSTMRQILVVSEDSHITYENYDALDTSVI